MPHRKIPAVRIEIRRSNILKGEVGLFAVRTLKMDSIIIEAEHFELGQIIAWKDFPKFDSITKKKIMSFCPGNPKGFFAPKDLNYLSIAWYMNHSCKPNVGFNAKDDFVAMRNIRKGEELCWDYGFDETNPKFRMKCSCGEPDCRGFVTGNDWMVLCRNKRNLRYFSNDLIKHIKTKAKC